MASETAADALIAPPALPPSRLTVARLESANGNMSEVQHENGSGRVPHLPEPTGHDGPGELNMIAIERLKAACAVCRHAMRNFCPRQHAWRESEGETDASSAVWKPMDVCAVHAAGPQSQAANAACLRHQW